MKTEEIANSQVACPLCGSSDVAVLIAAKGASLAHDALGSSRTTVEHGSILRCGVCGFSFSEFRPSDDELHTLYREMDPVIYEKEAAGRRKTAQRHLRLIERHIRAGKLLDVGCASGALLRVAADANWDVCGIEPSTELAAYAQKALCGKGKVFASTLQDSPLEKNSIDALTLFDVLEHVTQPVEFLQSCAALVKPGGYLFLNVPDIGSREARWLGKRWPLLLAEHLNYFDRKTLRACGAKAGLELVEFERRPASFTVGYVLYRLTQHNIPGARLLHRLVEHNALGSLSIPVYLGETFAVWRKAA